MAPGVLRFRNRLAPHDDVQAPPSGGALQLSDWEYLGLFKVPADDPTPGVGTRWAYSEGAIACRRVDGQIRILLAGASSRSGHATFVSGMTAAGATSLPVLNTQMSAVEGNWSIAVGAYVITLILPNPIPGQPGIASPLYFTGRSTTSGAGNLTGIPSSGDGSIPEDLAEGTYVFLGGGDYNSVGDNIYEIDYPGADPELASAPRATLVDVWNNCFDQKDRFITGNNGGVNIRGLFWDEDLGILWGAFGDIYNTAGFHDPSLVAAKLNGDGSHQGFGPWRTAEHSQLTRGPLTKLSAEFAAAYTNGNRLAVSAPPTSGNANSPVGLVLYVVDNFDPETRTPDIVQPDYPNVPGTPVPCQRLIHHDGDHFQSRPATYTACYWAVPGNHSVTVGTHDVGDDQIEVADTTLYAQAGSFSNDVYVCLIGGNSIYYTGRSTESGAGFLTGVPTAGDGRILGPIADGTIVELNTYDSGRGGTTDTSDATFNQAALRLDLFNAIAWIRDEADGKEGLIACGKLCEAPSKEAGACHVWYGPSSGGTSTCVHGRTGPLEGTGPTTEYSRGFISTYSVPALAAVATGAVQPWNAEAEVDLAEFGDIEGDGAGQAFFNNPATYPMGGAAYDAEDRLLFLTENSIENRVAASAGDGYASVVHVLRKKVAA